MKKNPFIILLYSVCWAFLTSASCLLILTYFVYQFELQNQIVDLVIIFIYIISNLMAGMLIGVKVKEFSVIYSILSASIYVMILQLFSIIITGIQLQSIGTTQITTWVLCLGGNMIGTFIGKRAETQRKIVN